MSPKLFFTASICLVLSIYIGYSTGLKCYECAHGYVDHVSYEKVQEFFEAIELPVDFYCNSDRKPKDDLSVECDEDSGDGQGMSCLALNVDETTGAGLQVQFKLRGCFPTKDNVTQECASKSIEELKDLFPSKKSKIQEAIELAEKEFLVTAELKDTKGNACFCDSDECNPAMSIRSTHIAVVAAVGLLIHFLSN